MKLCHPHNKLSTMPLIRRLSLAILIRSKTVNESPAQHWSIIPPHRPGFLGRELWLLTPAKTCLDGDYPYFLADCTFWLVHQFTWRSYCDAVLITVQLHPELWLIAVSPCQKHCSRGPDWANDSTSGPLCSSLSICRSLTSRSLSIHLSPFPAAASENDPSHLKPKS